VPTADAPSIRTGDAAAITVDGLANAAHGTVERIFPRAEFTPRFVFSPRERPNLVVRIRVRIDDPEARLHGGLPAFVRFTPTTGAPTAAGPRAAP
jgi:HlyD family secretion protein